MENKKSEFPKIILHPKRDVAVRRFHPWVFSGAIKKFEGLAKDGDVVEVFDIKGDYLATGHYHKGSIMVRIFSFEQTDGDLAFWKNKLQKAVDYRQKLDLIDSESTNCYRL
ncbi:MAG: 23S rRNA (cytosine1962-C5)-methyltransferase, partial [Saprospiraceae bacterium]